ncbi:MAG TPA: hypothetical protein VLH13_00255, partial [Methanomassiliicoccales archaeon]|nr:hypothetical protein [Methanomassiliicoccales archaeon]
MADDFLKQLQLSKQIEQKAKEAAKVRKAAEENISAAEAALEKLKLTSDETAEAEKYLVEASASFKEKDYKNALALATQCINSTLKAQVQKVNEIIDGSRAMLDLMITRKVPVEPLSELATRAKASLGRGEHEEAWKLAQEFSDRTEQLINRVAADAFSQAQTELMVLERLRLETAPEKVHLASARKALDEGRFKASLDELDVCLEGARNTRREGFRNGREMVQELLSFAMDSDYDLSRANEHLGIAIAKMEANETELAFAELAAAEGEARSALAKGTQSILAKLRERATALRETGEDTTMVSKLIGGIKERTKDEDLREAHSLLSRTIDALRGMEMEVVARAISAMRTKMQIARRVGADTSAAQAELDQVKQRLAASDLKGALESVERGAALLESSLSGYQETQSQLEEFKHMLDKV